MSSPQHQPPNMALSDGGGTVRHVMTLPNPWTTPTVSVPDAGRYLGMSPRTAYRRAAAGTLPTVNGRVSVFTLYSLLGAPVPARPVPPSVRR